MTMIAEDIQAMVLRRDALRVELQDVERQLLDAREILSMAVNNQSFRTRHGRPIRGDSCRAKILEVLSAGGVWASREIYDRVPFPRVTTASKLSRMVADGSITRVRRGFYRKADEAAAEVT